jgi:hypothetical protein
MKLVTIPKPESFEEYEGLPVAVKEAIYDLNIAERKYRAILKKFEMERGKSVDKRQST